jgi:hypothetical protein
MTTISFGQAARLTGRGKTILGRAISGWFFAGSTEDGGSNSSEAARVYPFVLNASNSREIDAAFATLGASGSTRFSSAAIPFLPVGVYR